MQMTEAPDRSAVPAMAALTLAAFFWSGNFIAGRALGGTIPPLELNVIRWALCLALLLPLAVPALVRCRAELAEHWRLIVLLGLTGIAAFHTMVYQALTLTPAVNALLILSLAPVVTVIGGAIWNGFRPGKAQFAGLAISAVGAGIIVVSGRGNMRAGFADAGSLWMLGAILVWAAYSLLLRRRPATLPQDVTLTASVIVGLCVMAPLLAIQGVQPIPMTGPIIAALGYIALCASLLGFLLWSWGLDRIGPERAGQFLHLMPVFGTVLAVALLGERLTLTHVSGGALAVCGIVLVNRR
ncbi:drug/metabolite transporter (DMT)-like permease [Rhodovulum iodosum]|uniref:Drug/metabolite transporter (DMT)-like permease n=1 Tax=Rhodovulum iodosum TaxID=68291 RepID=A0ABV3XQA6_9RHOB|nr:DMT family transporter [Rhodovulum robiginosum]RSK39406.1 DMT family transporter [Rhodovulum robiginosum]